jgi:5-methyltetrahydropteroyltriglutamate--homocysteine methyltransferase
VLTSTERILTTHVGSLPRPPAVVEVLEAEDRSEPIDTAAAEATFSEAVNDAVRRQVAAGIDVVSDGEMSKISYATYIRHRLSGFVPAELPRAVPADLDQFPSFKERLARSGGTPTYLRPICRGPISFVNREPLERDLARLRAAVAATGAMEAFMNAPSPGVVAIFQPNEHYASEGEYHEALAAALRVEYQAIVDAGFVLQVDCPDLALGRHTKDQRATEEAFLRGAQERVDILNSALDGIPTDRIRAHVCWGNYEGPHHLDIELRRLLPALGRLRVGALLVEAANPRHAHEWELWDQAQLPEAAIVVPGVIDTTTNYIEHPGLVAQRICQVADRVGRERVIAGTDCGFGTFAGFGAVDPGIAYAKLETLAAGAALATERLW